MSKTPKYSICVCNYNMANTVEIALRSVLDQINDDYEVLVVDDGSSDQSISVIRSLMNEYPALRMIALERDPKRKLGFTRNVSISEAKGEYVLLHIDCDDIIAPYIIDFVNIFHQIESCVKDDFLLSGSPIQMGKRGFLLEHGPYRNIHRGEDRDLWARLSATDSLIPLSHQNFKTRLPKTRREKLYRAFFYTFDHLTNDFRGNVTLTKFFHYEMTLPHRFNLKTRLLRLALMLPAWTAAKRQGPISASPHIQNQENLSAYRARAGGAFTDIMRKYGGEPDWSAIRPEARAIF